ncbi:hypothetical protein LCGC14_1760450, partial [marine sediment metagenome]
ELAKEEPGYEVIAERKLPKHPTAEEVADQARQEIEHPEKQPTKVGDELAVRKGAKYEVIAERPLARRGKKVEPKPEGLTRAEVQRMPPRTAKALRVGQVMGEPIGYKKGSKEAKIAAGKVLTRVKTEHKISEELRGSFLKIAETYVTDPKDLKKLTRSILALTGKSPKRKRVLIRKIRQYMEKEFHKTALGRVKTAGKTLKGKYGRRGDPVKEMRPEFKGMASRLMESFAIPNLKPDTKINLDAVKSFAADIMANDELAEQYPVAYRQAKALINELRGVTEKSFPVRLLSTEALDNLADTMEWLMHEQEWANRQVGMEQGDKFEDIKARLKEEIVVRAKRAVPIEKGDVFGTFKRGAINFADIQHRNLESLCDAIAGGRSGNFSEWFTNQGTFTDSVYNQIDAGVDKQYFAAEEQRALVTKLMDKHKITDKLFVKWHKDKIPITINGKVYNLSSVDLMTTYMHSRNPHNEKALLRNGYKWGHGFKQKSTGPMKIAELDMILAHVTPQMEAFCEDIGNLMFDGLNKGLINKTSVEVDGFELATLLNYFPAERYLEKRAKGKTPRKLFSFVEGMGILQERVGTGEPLALRGIFETIYRNNQYVSAYHGMAAGLRNAKAIVNDPDVTQMMNENGYREYRETMIDLIEKVEDDSAETDMLEKFWAKRISKAAKSIFALNPKLSPRQQISSALYFAYSDMRFVKDMRHIMTPDVIKFMQEYMPQEYTRIKRHQYDRDVGTAMLEKEPYRYFTGKALKRDLPLYPMSFFDGNAISDGVRIAMAEVKHNQPDIKVDSQEYIDLVKKRASWLIRHTQPTWHNKDRTKLGATRNPLTKALTMFMSQRAKLVQMLVNAAEDFKYSNKTSQDYKRLGKVYGSVMTNAFFIALFDTMFAALVYRKRKSLKDFLVGVTRQVAGLPYFGRVIADTIRAADAMVTGKGYQK